MTKSSCYAVAAGRLTGIFSTWTECEAQVKGFTGCRYKKFKTKDEAQAFIDGYNQTQAKITTKRSREESDQATDECKSHSVKKRKQVDTVTQSEGNTEGKDKSKVVQGSWYAVAKGRETGVFQTWKEAKKQVENLQSAKFKKFTSQKEAQEFVDQHAAATITMGVDPDPEDPETLVAFCDGSALGNGRQSCRAGYACIFPHCEEWNVAKQMAKEHSSTNNRAEFMAALEAMKRANLVDPKGSRLLFIFSDSMLLIRSMTEWVDTWKTKNWIKSNGDLVKNRDLLELLVAEKGNRQIRWIHVKAHTEKTDWRSKWNDVADCAARNAAMSVCGD